MRRSNHIRSEALLNFATAVILLGALFLLLRPQSPLRISITEWWETWRTNRAVKTNWTVLNEVAIGERNASDSLMLVEILDYQCPFCSRVQPIVDSAEASGVRVIYILMPKPEHELAFDAAALALCAEYKGMFRTVHELLLSDSSWYTSGLADPFDRILSKLPDSEQIRTCMRQSHVMDRLKRHTDVAELLGVKGTPVIIAKAGFFRGAITSAALLEFASRN